MVIFKNMKYEKNKKWGDKFNRHPIKLLL